MIEIPEALTLTHQITSACIGKKVTKVVVNQNPHKLAWLSGDTDAYTALLVGKVITGAEAHGGLVEIVLGDSKLLVGDGVNLRYTDDIALLPPKHQLYVEFTSGECITASVQMYGGIWCFKGDLDYSYYHIACQKPSPPTEAFNYDYFHALLTDSSVIGKSIKAALATEQRIPGLGNGVLQDILFNARIHPKRKVKALSDNEIKGLYASLKATLKEMSEKGGRDTEKDLFGNPGGYATKMSSLTVDAPCTVCGGAITKEVYMGGSVYYCGECQKV